MWKVYEMFYEFLSKRKNKTYILKGNHDISSNKGFCLSSISHGHKGVFVYEEKAEVEIEGIKCLMLPWIHNYKEEYEQIKWKGDYCFLHVTNSEDAFGSEGVELKDIDAIQIYGHTHTRRLVNDRKIVQGVPLATRNKEVVNPLIKIIDNNTYEFVDMPIYFEFQTLEYQQLPENKNNILNIINAPSSKAVYETYKGYYVRDEGIELLRTENEQTLSEMKQVFEGMNLVNSFVEYEKEETHLKKEIYDEAISRLNRVIE